MVIDQIPGLSAAVDEAARREQALRRFAWHSLNPLICGVEVRPLTPRHYLILLEAESPFIVGGEPLDEHVAQFLWVLSPVRDAVERCACRMEYKARLAGSRPADEPHQFRAQHRAAFVKSLLALNFHDAVDAIRCYIDDALMDRPVDGASDERPIASMAAWVVDDIAAEYGWPEEVLDEHGCPIPGGGILDKPFARLFQQMRIIGLRRNPRAPMPNRISDAVERHFIRQWIAERNAKQRQQQETGDPSE